MAEVTFDEDANILSSYGTPSESIVTTTKDLNE